jgi:hypothetical protein
MTDVGLKTPKSSCANCPAEGEEMTLPPNSNIRWTAEEDQQLLDLVAAEATGR